MFRQRKGSVLTNAPSARAQGPSSPSGILVVRTHREAQCVLGWWPWCGVDGYGPGAR